MVFECISNKGWRKPFLRSGSCTFCARALPSVYHIVSPYQTNPDTSISLIPQNNASLPRQKGSFVLENNRASSEDKFRHIPIVLLISTLYISRENREKLIKEKGDRNHVNESKKTKENRSALKCRFYWWTYRSNNGWADDPYPLFEEDREFSLSIAASEYRHGP